MPESAPTVLAYARRLTPASRQLTMTDIGNTVTITYALPPRWVPWLAIAAQLFYVVSPAAHAVLLIWVWRHWFHSASPGPFLWPILWYVALIVLVALLAAHSLMKHLRWGQVAKTLTANRDSFTLRWLGFRRMSERSWKCQDVRSIKLKSDKDVFTRKTTCRLIIRLKKGWRRTIVIPSKDHLLATQIRESLTRVLAAPSSPGCTSGAPNAK